MNSIMRVACAIVLCACGCATQQPAHRELQWISFPDARLDVRGLPWFEANAPELWRLPKSEKANVPAGAWARAVAPDGGRICFSSDTATLQVRVETEGKGSGFFDAFVDGKPVGSGKPNQDGTVVLFSNQQPTRKNITIYLPHKSQVRVLAVGIDSGAKLKPSAKFAKALPIVCYGSSVLQGSGAAHASQTYPAVVARKVDLDFVNLGFGGAGKAEPQVVALVNKIDASCYLFDLGKSYGNQVIAPFANMLKTIRASHPKTPLIVVTPIFSTKEINDPAYKTKSETLRSWMRDAANEMQHSGDHNIYVVEGLDLFGEGDKALFHDSLHPND
ncbi:MAG: SGNH/GDSL hydrolase family protein, partial [Limisphaerales bacterium]